MLQITQNLRVSSNYFIFFFVNKKLGWVDYLKIQINEPT